jgi:hypothetical protein
MSLPDDSDAERAWDTNQGPFKYGDGAFGSAGRA